jgi:hypothetical protein
MMPRWAVVDQMVHELGSLRAVVQEVDARPELAEADVALELRVSLARAADTIHLVIGGDEAMVAQAWRTIAEAQAVSARARQALTRSRVTHARAQVIRDAAKANGRSAASHIEDLRSMRGATEGRRTPKKDLPPRD